MTRDEVLNVQIEARSKIDQTMRNTESASNQVIAKAEDQRYRIATAAAIHDELFNLPELRCELQQNFSGSELEFRLKLVNMLEKHDDREMARFAKDIKG